MRKRLKKKLGLYTYNVLRDTIHKSNTQKPNDESQLMGYRFLPIGDRDYKAMNDDTLVYPYATHWLIVLYSSGDKTLMINVFPCSREGSTTDDSPLRIIMWSDDSFENGLDFLEEIVEDMRNDEYWNSEY
ncbi:hypothetical protein AB1K18_22365 [Peribacillus simplex]|uniref:hypothetical protein n=1 Tax=Peribacillus simplex TaxID=1478 RepID=UPI003B8C1FD9